MKGGRFRSVWPFVLLACACSGSQRAVPSASSEPATPRIAPISSAESIGEPDTTADAPDEPPSVSLPRPRLLWRRAGVFADTTRELVLTSVGPDSVRIDLDASESLHLDARTGSDRPARPKQQPVPPKISFRLRGDEVVAFDPARTSEVLWSEPGAAKNERAFVEPVVSGRAAYVLKPRELVKREVPSGRVLSRHALPPFLAEHVERHHVKLVADGDRFALVERAGFAMHGVVVTGTDSARSVLVLDRPMPIAEHLLLSGSRLFLYNAFDGVLGAYDLASTEPPLASLAPEQAFASVREEMRGEERLMCDRLALLSNLGPTWVKLLDAPSDPLWGCALSLLADRPEPGAGPVLRRLAKNPPKVVDPEDESNLYFILSALAADDELETSRTLVEFARRPDAGTLLEGRGHAADLAWQQLWRTRRTSEFGFCPKTEQSRKVPELAKTASDGSIGTKHPLLFQRIASDGSWTLVCQARKDSDRDGTIKVMIGRHGEALGDAMNPYLVVGSGPGWTFDDTIDADPTSRFVAVREGACLSLVDTRTSKVVRLPNADLRDDGRFVPARGAVFDAQGTRLLYLRGGANPDIVVRDLASGREKAVSPGRGLIWEARFDETGGALEVLMIPSGRFPTFATTLARRRCRGEPASYSVFGGERFRPVLRRVDLDSGTIEELGDPASHPAPKRNAPTGIVKRVEEWERRSKGEFAERTDGAILGLDVSGGDRFSDVPVGPLRWRAP